MLLGDIGSGGSNRSKVGDIMTPLEDAAWPRGFYKFCGDRLDPLRAMAWCCQKCIGSWHHLTHKLAGNLTHVWNWQEKMAAVFWAAAWSVTIQGLFSEQQYEAGIRFHPRDLWDRIQFLGEHTIAYNTWVLVSITNYGSWYIKIYICMYIHTQGYRWNCNVYSVTL